MDYTTHNYQIKHLRGEKGDDGKIQTSLNTYYIHIDLNTFYADNETNGVFKWDIVSNGQSGNTSIGVHVPINNVVEIELDTFTMPIVDIIDFKKKYNFNSTVYDNISNISTGINLVSTNIEELRLETPYTSSLSQIPHDHHFKIYIKETGNQSASDVNGKRYNFLMRAAILDALIKADGIDSDVCQAIPINKIYKLGIPITHMRSITLEFRSGDEKLLFLPHVYKWTEVKFIKIDEQNGDLAPTYALVFRYDDFNKSENSLLKLSSGDRIYIRDYKSLNNNLNDYINRNEGHLIQLISNNTTDVAYKIYGKVSSEGVYNFGGYSYSSHYFTTNPIVSLRSADAVNSYISRCNVYIDKRQMNIGMRLKCMNT